MEEKKEIVVCTAAPTPDRRGERPLSTIEERPQLEGDVRRKEGGHAGRESTVSSSSRSIPQAQPATEEGSLESIPRGDVGLSVATSTGYSDNSSLRAVPPLRFQSYGDERFFTRLRASLNPADWEATKAAEKEERESQIAAAEAARTSERLRGMLDTVETVGVSREGVEAPKGQLSTE